MKKVLLLIAAGLLTSLGLFAQTTISLMPNPYGTADDFNAPNTSVFPSTYTTPKAGDILTLTVKGKSNYDITQLQAVCLGNGSSYVELSGYTTIGVVTANTEFNFSVDILLKSDAGVDGIKLVFDAKSQAAVDAKAASVDLTLSNLSMTVTPFIPGVTTLTASGAIYQGIFQDTIPETKILKKGDVVRFTVGGKYVSTADATNLEVYVVNNSVDAVPANSYWQPLSDNSILSAGPIVSGQTFSYTIDNVITADQVGTTAAAHKIVLVATSTANVKIQNLTIKAEVNPSASTVAVTGVTLDKTTATLTTVGATAQLTATIAPADATVKTYTYITSDAKVATVSATGLVTAVANGTATITVSTTDGAKTATSVITVSIPKTGISILDLGISQKGKVFTFDGSAKLLNLLGQVVLTGENTIDASFVAPGIYFITKDNTTLEISVQ